MNKTAIEWCDFSVNPVRGLCPVACSYCYARAMYHRFKWDETIRFDEWPMASVVLRKKPARIFVGSTMELFGDHIPEKWMHRILQRVRNTPWHTFIFLAKRPENLARWNPWPDNAWVGTSVTGCADWATRTRHLAQVEAPVRFVSLEPLRDHVCMSARRMREQRIDWLIIGAQTPPSEDTRPDPHWITHITSQADEARIPVFLKDNLYRAVQRREWPRNGNNQD